MSTDEFAEHIDVLHEIEKQYQRYVDAFYGGSDTQQLRSQLLRRAGRGQRAMAASGVRFAITPAPLYGGAVLRSLPEQLFAFERPAYGPHAIQLVHDAISTAIGLLEDQMDAAQRRKASPTPPVAPPKQPKWPSDGARIRRSPLFGRVRQLPGFVAFAADLGTAGAVIYAILKGVGVI